MSSNTQPEQAERESRTSVRPMRPPVNAIYGSPDEPMSAMSDEESLSDEALLSFAPNELTPLQLVNQGNNEYYDDNDVPASINYQLILTVDHKEYKPRNPNSQPPERKSTGTKLFWGYPDSFATIKEDCEAYKNYITADRSPDPAGTHTSTTNAANEVRIRTYFRYGYLKVIGTRNSSVFDPRICKFNPSAREESEDEEDKGTEINDERQTGEDEIVASHLSISRVARNAIINFTRDHPNERFQLHIYCDYGYMENEPKGRETFCQLMHYQYARKMTVPSKTILKQSYISYADLVELTRASVTDRIIGEFRLSDENKLRWRKKVHEGPASTLLAVCVWKKIDPEWFMHFVETHGFSDGKSPPPDEIPCTDDEFERCDLELSKLRDGINTFFARAIWPDKCFRQYTKEDIIPVSWVWEQGMTEKQRDEKGEPDAIGCGAYSQVFNVQVDIGHNRDKSTSYALKRFRKLTSGFEKNWENFVKEVQMLGHLARFPHPHLLTHITGWQQEKEFYILYDKANCNLAEYMNKNKYASGGTDLSNVRIQWFFKQIHGLAGAVDCIHQRRPQRRSRNKGTNSNPVPTTAVPSIAIQSEGGSRSPTSIAAYHHDIKLENILAFGPLNGLPTLKLSDFGSGKLCSEDEVRKTLLKTEVARGTPLFFGPEYEAGMPKGQPFDMWALGCTLLEMLLWFLGEDTPDEGKFVKLRRKRWSPKAPKEYFWEIVDRGATSLNVPNGTMVADDYRNLKRNEAVDEYLQKLRDLCNGMPAFRKLIKQIDGLLQILPEQRTKAMYLLSDMKAICTQLDSELASSAPSQSTANPSARRFSYAEQFEMNRKVDRGEMTRAEGQRHRRTPPQQVVNPSYMSVQGTVVGDSPPPSPGLDAAPPESFDTLEGRHDPLMGISAPNVPSTVPLEVSLVSS